MKTFFKALAFLIAFLPLSIHAQQAEVKAMVDKMFADVLNKDFESLLNMTHPKVFDLVPKEQMLPIIKSTFEGNDEFSVELPKETPSYKISEVFKGKNNNLEYAFVTYDMAMNMTFKKQEFDEESKKMMIPIMKAQGMDVTFTSSNSMNVLMRDRLTIFLKEDATKNEWVVVNYDANSPLFYQVLSSDLLEAAKTYKQNLMLESKKKTEN